MAVAITKKPTGGVWSLAVARDAYKMAATWKVPDSLTSEKSKSRATRLAISWYIGITGVDPRRMTDTGNMTATSNNLLLYDFTIGNRHYDRSSFYPLTSTKLWYVTCKVQAHNDKGWSPVAPSVTYKFEPPRHPSISQYSVDTDTGVISTSIVTDPGVDRFERYDTEYYWQVRNTTTGQMLKNEHSALRWGTINLSVNVSALQSLGTGYVECVCRARARGFAGTSEWVERKYYLAFPNSPIIRSIDAPTGTTGTVVAYINVNRTTQHPVTKVQLQALVDSEYATIEEASAASSEWENVGAPDDGACSALAVNVADVRPTTAGRHSWLRVRAVDVIDNLLVAYSAPMELTTLYRPAYSATGDTVAIVNGVPGADGESAVMTLGWDDDGSDGTELSWSNEQDTWRSTDEPDTFNVLYDDGPLTYGTDSYDHSATITI